MTDEMTYPASGTGLPADAQPVLVLQGGGALGSYQVGAFEALCACEFAPQWVAGISIGAINAALIAGNTPDNRHQRLNAFWDKVSSQATWPAIPWLAGDGSRTTVNEWNAGVIMLAGVPGFFKPRFPPMPFQSPDDLGALSFYDTSPLRETLEEMVDFKLINSAEGVRISVGAVNVATGQQRYFDNKGDNAVVIGPEHIMASAALPPGFPAVRIGKDYFWDGGLISNTPLDHVLKHKEHDNLLIFQLDLFSAEGRIADLARRNRRTRKGHSLRQPDRDQYEKEQESLQRGATSSFGPQRSRKRKSGRAVGRHGHGDPSDLPQRVTRGCLARL